jgi:FMN phosphatase YigB (HAD superfamily)
MPQTPRTVIFDLGKVLVDFDWTVAARRIAARTRLSPAQLLGAMMEAPLLVSYEKGLLTTAQVYAAVRELTGFDGTLAEFSEFFADIFTEIAEMTALHAAVRARGVPTFVLSNTNALACEHIHRHFPFFANFEGYVLSFEHGAMKPEPKLYEVAEQWSGRRAAEILFIDDRPENIAAARARGWQAILQQSPELTRAELRRLGLLG